LSIGTPWSTALPSTLTIWSPSRMPALVPGAAGDRRGDRKGAFVHLDLDPDPAILAVQVLLQLGVVLHLQVLGMGVQGLHHPVDREL
jgi:hypothetical protein